MNRRLTRSIRAALIAFVVLTLTTAVSAQQAVFRIGVLDSDRGPLANGARLAAETINNSGGVRGADGELYRLEIITQATNSGVTTEAAVTALRSAGVVAAIGPSSTDEVLNTMSLLQRLNVPVLTPATGDTVITSDSSGRLMRVRAADAVQGQALASFFINEFGLRRIATIQLDIASTANAIGFSTAASTLGAAPSPALLLRQPDELSSLIGRLIAANPDVIVAFGDPSSAGVVLRELREAEYGGIFAYNQPDDPVFQAQIPAGLLNGIISSTTWAFTAADSVSVDFLTGYVRTFARLPSALDAASYDAVRLLAAALSRPGDLGSTLQALDFITGVQGLLRPAQLAGGELNDNVTITRLNDYGAPEALARYAGGQRLPEDLPILGGPQVTIIPPTPTAAPTATPAGVVITIRSSTQNVRTGPGIIYPVLGQLSAGEQATVIGASADNAWVVITYRGQQGWLATYLLDVFGDLNQVPIINPPPVPTPVVPPTATPSLEPDIVIDNVTIQPSIIVPGQPFVANISVRNIGATPTGAFSIGGVFPSDNLSLSVPVPSLAPSQVAIIGLSGILTRTGTYGASIIADVNFQVNEGPFGEANNTFSVTYSVDRPVRNVGSQTLNLGETIDVEGDFVQGDANWNADGGAPKLDAIFGARLGILPSLDIAFVHYDLIDPAVITRNSIPRTELSAGMLIGMISANGNRAVLRVDAITDFQIALTFRVYNG